MEKIDLLRMERALKEAGWYTDLSAADASSPTELEAWRYDRGATERVTLRKGDANASISTNNPMRSVDAIAADIRRTYAMRTVTELAPKYGWKISNKTGNKITLKR